MIFNHWTTALSCAAIGLQEFGVGSFVIGATGGCEPLLAVRCGLSIVTKIDGVP